MLLQPSSASPQDPWFLWLALVGRGGGQSHQESWKEQSCFVFLTLVRSAAVCEVVGSLEYSLLSVVFPERHHLFSDFLPRFHYVCEVTVSGIRPAKTSFLYCAVFVHDIEVILPKMKLSSVGVLTR